MAGDTTPVRESTTPPISLAEAWTRLTQDYPLLAEAVKQCCVQGKTGHAAGQARGVDFAQIHRRKRAGLAQLELWCALPPGMWRSTDEGVKKSPW